jgi:CBS domain-containing protein
MSAPLNAPPRDLAPLDLPTMHSPLGAVMRREPVVAPLDATVRAALQTMARENVGSIIVADPRTRIPLGIFTLNDLLKRVALAGGDLEEPVLGVMTAGLVTLKTDATAHQAATAMLRHGIGHIVVTDAQGRLAGLVSQSLLLDLKRPGVQELQREIAHCPDIPSLVHCAHDTRRLAQHLLAQGVGAEALSQFVTTLNDLVTIRVIELTIDQIELPDAPWCWLAFGSEGRLEQTLATDQDNGIVFEASTPIEAAHLRAAFVPFAHVVNQRLDACGFPLCKGGIMASNPRWCLSLTEWRRHFGAWINTPEPKALLNASIFFDLRPLYGAHSLAAQLQESLLQSTAASPLFLRTLTENGLQVPPPLGVIRTFSYRSPKEYPNTIDLKGQGARLFVDAARVLALAHGIRDTNTAQRLGLAAQSKQLGSDDVRAMIDAYFFIQSLRLRNQHAGAVQGAANRINPAHLNELDRLILKEAFKQARKLQQRLKLDYLL